MPKSVDTKSVGLQSASADNVGATIFTQVALSGRLHSGTVTVSVVAQHWYLAVFQLKANTAAREMNPMYLGAQASYLGPTLVDAGRLIS